MANLLSNNPIILTSPLATSYKAAASISGFVLRVRKVIWKSPQTIGDTLLIIDPTTGKELLRLSASPTFSGQSGNLPTQTQDYSTPELWYDFAVPQIDSGTAYIYLD